MFVFFFKQKTAYEMRISDWSSDVCSSDLKTTTSRRIGAGCRPYRHAARRRTEHPRSRRLPAEPEGRRPDDERAPPARSEERRVGKEGVSTCRSRRSPHHEKITAEIEQYKNKAKIRDQSTNNRNKIK